MRAVGVRGRGWALVVALSMVAVAACGTSSPGGPETQAEALATVDESQVTRGGRLVIGINAESNGWSPVANQWTLNGHLVGSAVYESLTAVGTDGVVSPYLAESVTSNADHTEWRIRMRPDVRFHDGTPCDAAAVAANLEASKAGIGGITLRTVSSIEVEDPLTLVVRMSTPWATFPSALAGQQGYIASPRSLEDGTASTRPVGTGPFRFTEWIPDRRTVVTASDDYRVEGLPYLDEIEFQPITDPLTRKTALRTGALDLMYIASPDDVRELRDAGDLTVVTDSRADETVVVLNAGSPPYDRLDVRRAIAQATDQKRVVDVLGAGVTEGADGPFHPDEPWYTPDSRMVGHDRESARRTVDAVAAETGAPLTMRLIVSPDQPSVARAELVSQMWREVGVETTILALEQGAFIKALTGGDFDGAIISNFGYADPDFNYLFWHSSMVGPPGQISPNFSRTADPQIDAALEAARRTDDVEARAREYRTITQRLNEQVAYVWLHRTPGSLAAAPDVRGLGEPARAGFGRADAKPWLARLWLQS